MTAPDSFDRFKQRRLLAEGRRTPHNGCQIKTKTVDVERVHPVLQAFIREMHDRRVAEIERVTATGPVEVIAIVPDQ